MIRKIFIDGRSGTTGLKIVTRLAERQDIQSIILSEDERKDPLAREKALNECDIAFLCLPDAAAREAVSMIHNPNVRVIDTSTAHRTDPGWVYGFPELSEENFNKIQNSARVAIPGCHASGFVALIFPLIENGLLSEDALLTCHSLTGYSGGGKQMIEAYESKDRPLAYSAPRQYGLSQEHKHLKEMQKICSLRTAPVFCPIVADYYCGMLVTVPLHRSQLNADFSKNEIVEIYRACYNGPVVKFVDSLDQNGMADANDLAGKDKMMISMSGNEDRFILMAQFDNLGKGASGAAVQCMNIMLGLDPLTGLVI